ncbi:hypothetical protein B0H11DRAFT_1915005 [Mycena galericulata]|nr:hypothetical protein B0H11DRAFT_1915005 [Mycena galericulata]
MSRTMHYEIATQLAQCLDILGPMRSGPTSIKTHRVCNPFSLQQPTYLLQARRMLEVLQEDDQLVVLVLLSFPTLNSNFAARFLPSLVAAYKHIPGTAHDWILSKISLLATPYFARFLRNSMGWDLYDFGTDSISVTESTKLLPLDIMEAVLTLFQLLLCSTYDTRGYLLRLKSYPRSPQWDQVNEGHLERIRGICTVEDVRDGSLVTTRQTKKAMWSVQNCYILQTRTPAIRLVQYVAPFVVVQKADLLILAHKLHCFETEY